MSNDDAHVDLNPYSARIIGFVDEDGILSEVPEGQNWSNLLISMGSDDNVKSNARVLVFALGAEITDPDTEESLGHFEIVRGEGRVTTVQSRMAVIRSTNTKTTVYQKPLNAAAALMGASVEVGERQVHVPFKGAEKGDFVRFI